MEKQSDSRKVVIVGAVDVGASAGISVAGAEIPMGSAKLTADVRYVFLNYDFQQVPELSGLHSDFFMVTFGILFGI